MKRLALLLLFLGTCLFNEDNTLCVKNVTDILENGYALSIAGMVQLLSMEDEIIIILQEYEDAVKGKLDIIKPRLDQLQTEHKKSASDPEAYLSNPLNSFALMRRMHSDWHKWQAFMSEPEGKSQIDSMEYLQSKLPTAKDMNEAVASIFRIQETYQLKAKDMARGLLNGVQYNATLTSLDCFEIANYLNEQKKCAPGIRWYNTALSLYSTFESELFEVYNVSQANMLYLTADCWLESDNTQKSMSAINQAIAHEPNNSALLIFRRDLQNFITHDKLCRHEISQTSRLHCHYNTTTTPFLKLAPLKIEEIAMDPYIVLYHNVISDREIKEVQAIAMQSMGRAGTSLQARDPQRTANAHNIQYDYGQTGRILFQRLLDMTGLNFDIKQAHLHVVNYGIGGHYYNHVDYAPKEIAAKKKSGNRIASILFYLNNVEQGGETAFGNLRKVVPTQKGSAILWYHLDNTGKGNRKSMHASCPVIFGSKWMAITSTFVNDQMFIIPCIA